jgi:hypothetical protein
MTNGSDAQKYRESEKEKCKIEKINQLQDPKYIHQSAKPQT